MLLFLDTYYVDGSTGSVGFYDWFKDMILPSATLLLTILFSIRLSKKSFEMQKNKEEDAVRNEEKSIHNLVKSTVPKIIDNLLLQVDHYKKASETFSIENFNHVMFYQGNISMFVGITSISYHKLFQVLSTQAEMTNDEFVKFWNIIYNTPDHYKAVREYSEYVNLTFNELNKDLNNYTKNIANYSSDIIHNVFPPFTTIELQTHELENPEIKLPFMVYQCVESFQNNDGSSRLSKIKKFLSDLHAINEDSVASKALKSDYAQDIATAIGIMNGIEGLFDTATKSYNHYVQIFERTVSELESFKMN